MLGQGMTLRQMANEFEVRLNSVEHWRQCWVRVGPMGLYEGYHSGRPPSVSCTGWPMAKTVPRVPCYAAGTASSSRA